MNGTPGADPLTAPLSYPGEPPRPPAVLVTGAEIFAIEPRPAAALGEWPVRRARYPAAAEAGTPLDRFLRAQAAAPAGQRTPVLSVGSNASPAQLRRKMANAAVPMIVPMTAVRVHGLAAGVSAHVSAPGYVPATPVEDPAAVAGMWVLWLDAAGLAALDATEPNYRRVRVPPRHPIFLPPGAALHGCSVYVSRHGHLVDARGEPRRLTDQAALISALLAEVPALSALAGRSPAEWIRRTRDERVRDGVRELFRTAGTVRASAFGACPEPGRVGAE